MPITKEQTYTNGNYTLEIKGKIRALVNVPEYVDRKINRGVEISEAEKPKNCITCRIIES